MNINSDNISSAGINHTFLIHQLFEQQLSKSPDVIAVAFGSDSLTYTQLNQKANSLAAVIRAQSPVSAIVGVSTKRSVETIVSVLAILKTGKTYLPLDPDYPKDRLEQIIKDSGIDSCLVSQKHEALFDGLQINILLSDKLYPEANTTYNATAPSGAYVLYTSGSTGTPKGVLMGHAALSNLLLWQKNNSISAPGINTLQFAPLTFDVSFQEIFATLTTGGTLVLV
jgi:non-ribosomal peptide synthetase component F